MTEFIFSKLSRLWLAPFLFETSSTSTLIITYVSEYLYDVAEWQLSSDDHNRYCCIS
jgi:hypothetical protein